MLILTASHRTTLAAFPYFTWLTWTHYKPIDTQYPLLESWDHVDVKTGADFDLRLGSFQFKAYVFLPENLGWGVRNFYGGEGGGSKKF